MITKKMGYKFLLLSASLLVLSSNICAQTAPLLHPLHATPLLSGNFGELRVTHLHSGVDFKTGGREGLPVICVKDGIVARVKVSPTGYGNALYIQHPDGITTVYGHLNRFAPRVTKVVREIQYNKESFAIDENLLDRDIRFRAGDTIAYSGNTGSSMGPHLHFEVRETESEHALNPLNYLSIKDETGPTVRGLYIYTFSPEGVRLSSQRVEAKNTGNRQYQAPRVSVPAGKVGIGIQTDDFMKDSWNKLGIYDMELTVNDRTLFKLKMDSLSFGQSPLVNDIKDYHQYQEGRYVYTTFGHYQHLVFGVTNTNGGYISIDRDSVADVSIVLADINGNRSRVKFRIVGKAPAPALELPAGSSVLQHDEEHALPVECYTLHMEPNTLTYPVIVTPRVDRRVRDSVDVLDVFSVTEREYPLLKNALVSVKGTFPEKSLLCRVDRKGRFAPLSTSRKPDRLEAPVRVLGEYTVRQDTLPPVIIYSGVSGRTVRFRITDDLSGIASYRVEVNGKWCLFRYDAKNRLLEGSLNEPVFVKGKNHLVLKVEDAVKNESIFETEVYKK